MNTTAKTPLTDQEIRTLAAIIQTCSQRGAFKAEEMLPVGTLYNRLMAMAQTQTMIQTGDKDEEKEKETK